MTRIVVLDPHVELARALAARLGGRGFVVETIHDGASAAERLYEGGFDGLVVDLHVSSPDGWNLIRRARSLPDPPVIVAMGTGIDVDDAVRALHQGATDCVAKPATVEVLTERVERALARYHVPDDEAAVAQSPAMRRVFALADRVAGSDRTAVLICGESGVGKEVVARRIHERSARAGEPFVAVNLAALPDPLVEAELFGHRRGSFTGSVGDRPGKFRSAAGGTLLLDELCEMKPLLQSKLLRVLESRRYFPVGGDVEEPTDVRVLAATNRDPKQAIDDGVLRADLYYRLSTVTLRIPPLRERPEDIRPLAHAFLRRIAREHAAPPRALTDDGVAFLETRAWPGNARELRNLLERAVVLDDGESLDAVSLRRAAQASRPPPPGVTDSGWDLMAATQRAVEAVEREQIVHAMRVSDGVVNRAAELLQVSRTTLWAKIRKYELEDAS